MRSILKTIVDFFRYEPTVYSHRHRTIEKVASERNIDIGSIIAETKTVLASEGRVEAILKLQKRFHVPLNTAWVFVDKLDNNK